MTDSVLDGLKCYQSKKRLFRLWFLGLVLVAISYFSTTSDDAVTKVIGWLGIIFFGFLIILNTVRAFRPSVQVQIDNNGITDFRINFGLITWRDLKKVRIKNVRSQRFLCLEVANPEIYLSKLSATKRKLAEIDNALGIPRIVIGFSSLEPSIDAVVKYIRVKYPEKVANSA